jgi:phosphoglucomutase
MLASAVSSKMLKAVAEKEGFLFEETLTGFKWIGENGRRKEEGGRKGLPPHSILPIFFLNS